MSKKVSRQERALIRLHQRITNEHSSDRCIPAHLYEEWKGLISNMFSVPRCTCFVFGYIHGDTRAAVTAVTNPMHPDNQVYIGGNRVRAYVVEAEGVLQKNALRWYND